MVPTLALAVLVWSSGVQAPLDREAEEIRRLEHVWNEAHVQGDVPALEALCADDLQVTVPGMPPMSKADILGFWKSGRAKITRYDTTGVQIEIRGDTAIATGRLARTRDFNGKTIDDVWQFMKTYARRAGRWVLVSYRASDGPGRDRQ